MTKQPTRPASLTVLTIIAIILGCLITLGGLSQIAGLLFQDHLNQLGQLQADQPGISSEIVESQRQMQQQMLEVQQRWKLFNWFIAPLSLLFGLALAISGIMALTLKPAGRRWLAWVCAVGVGLTLVSETGSAMMSVEINSVTRTHMEQMMGGQGGAQGQEIMSGVMGASMAMSVAFLVAWGGLKIAFYLWGLIAMTRESSRKIFERPQPQAAE